MRSGMLSCARSATIKHRKQQALNPQSDTPTRNPTFFKEEMTSTSGKMVKVAGWAKRSHERWPSGMDYLHPPCTLC